MARLTPESPSLEAAAAACSGNSVFEKVTIPLGKCAVSQAAMLVQRLLNFMNAKAAVLKSPVFVRKFEILATREGGIESIYLGAELTANPAEAPSVVIEGHAFPLAELAGVSPNA